MGFPDLTPSQCRKTTCRNSSGICTQCTIPNRQRSEGFFRGLYLKLDIKTSFEIGSHSPGPLEGASRAATDGEFSFAPKWTEMCRMLHPSRHEWLSPDLGVNDLRSTPPLQYAGRAGACPFTFEGGPVRRWDDDKDD